MQRLYLYRLVESAWKHVPHPYFSIPRIFYSPCRSTENWTFSIAFWLPHLHGISFGRIHTNHYKHSMSNGIRVQLVMRFSSKRMCVVFTPCFGFYTYSFIQCVCHASRIEEEKFIKSSRQRKKIRFSIFRFVFCWMWYKFHKTSTHIAYSACSTMALAGFLCFPPPANKLNKNKRDEDDTTT